MPDGSRCSTEANDPKCFPGLAIRHQPSAIEEEGGRMSSASVARGRRDVLMAAVLWSLSGVVTKSLDLDATTIAFYRGLFAGLVLVPFVPRSRRVVRPEMLPLGLVFGAMTGLYLGAVKTTTAANAI